MRFRRLTATALMSLAISMCLLLGASALRDLLGSDDDDGGRRRNKRKVIPEREVRIIGGSDARSGRYPYMVALLDRKGNFFCGGTLIESDSVLSAAHCKGAKYVKIGSYDFGGDDEDDFERISVDEEIIHPKYDENTLENDVMIIKLKEKSSKTTIKLNLDGKEVGLDNRDRLTVMGWGAVDKKGNRYPDRLQEVEVKYVEDCEDDFPEGDITPDMMCAGKRGKDSCFGDSGGPLIRRGADAGDDVQVGVVSWGYGCADRKYPSVYAKLSHEAISDFIKDEA
jgi:trypsin